MKAWIMAAVAVLGISGAGAADLDKSANSSRNSSIRGVWVLDVTLINCTTGAPVGVPVFQAINTFHQGGTMSEHGSRFSPALRGVGQGVWKQVAHRRYTSRFLFERFDAGGTFIGTQEVERRMTLSADGETLSMTANVRILDTNGVVLVNGCATEEGRRF